MSTSMACVLISFLDHGATERALRIGRWYGLHRLSNTGVSVMVQDAALVNGLQAVAGRALSRSDVIVTPRAAQIFAIYDVIVAEDPRLMTFMIGDDD